jgi:AraC family transcriptional regulator
MDWRNIHVQRLRLTLETPEHDHADHFLTLQLGPPGLIESREADQHLRSRVTPGDFTLIGANRPHQVRYEGVDQLAVSLDSDFVSRVAAELGEGASAAEDIEFVPQHGTHDPQIERLGQLLRAEIEAGCPTGPLFAEGIAQALTAHLLRRYSTIPAAVVRESFEPEPLSPARLRRTLDYLEANLGQEISLAEMATVAGLSPFHFARQFKAATGTPPHAYLIARRIERAKELLARTNLPIAAVAVAVGFTHQSHLTRHFKPLVGTTPARFRDQSH